MLMPWFIPLAPGVAYAGTRLAVDHHRRKSARLGEPLFLLLLAWCPFLVWIIAQFISFDPRHP